MKRMFLDSGAFSAKSQGTPIDLNEYMKFIKKNKDQISHYANLDVIGDARASWENQRIMEAEGLTPLPVFHMEDDFKYLYECLMYDYFCLGGMAGESSVARIAFLDRCWEIICDSKDNLPISKVHGFGMSSTKLICRYPWYSVDSSSWVQYGLYGMILIPRRVLGVPDFTTSPVKVFVSSVSPRKSEEGKHFDNLTVNERHYVLEFLVEKKIELGMSEFKNVAKGYSLRDNEKFVNKEKTKVEEIIHPGVCNNGDHRDLLNYKYFMDLAASQPEYPWAYKTKNRRLF